MANMRVFICLVLSILLLTTALARSRRGKGSSIQPGQFDYYILALSWAPDFCDRPTVQHDARECGPGRRLGFVVHGLWPQLDDGGHPSQCAPARPVAQNIVQRTLALIPSEGLIQHEWRDHGTCSGLSTAAYFDTVRRAYESVVIPPDFRQPDRRIDASPQDIEAKFLSANPRLRNSLRVACSSGELSEVRVCLAKDLSPRACSAHDTECSASRIGMLPVKEEFGYRQRAGFSRRSSPALKPKAPASIRLLLMRCAPHAGWTY
jgi:ribonuclease T2